MSFYFLKLRCCLAITVVALSVLTGCNGPVETSASLVQAQAWHMDKTGQATLADIEAIEDWQTMQGWKAWGFGPETIWVRMHLRAADPGIQTPWSVLVRPAYLDYVTLYDPAAGLVQRSGDALPPSDDDLESINFTFQIPALSHERDIYLQLHSTSSRTFHAQVLPSRQVQRQNQFQEWSIGFIIVTSVIFGLWALVHWWVSGDRVIGAFGLKQLTSILWSFFFMGFARIVVGPWLPEGVLTTLASTCLFFFISAGTWFMVTLLETYRPKPMGLLICRILLVFLVCLPLMQLLGLTREMLVIANTSIMVIYIMVLLTALSGQQAGQPIPLKFLLAYFLVLGIVSSLSPLVHLGWFEANSWLVFSALSQTLLDGIVMFVMLQIRARAMQRTQQQTALDLQSSRERVAAEQRHREEQSQLFAMLAHEMKTPLATLRMWMEAGQLKRETMERAITDMNQVIELCLHTGQLADEGLQAAWQSTDPLALTRISIAACRAPERVDLAAPQPLELMETDPQMLSIVLGNLLDNACKYSAADSRIVVRLQSSMQNGCSGWLWQVSNQAGQAGLPEAQRLFEKYYRSPHARRLSGSGLGLFLVKGLLTLLQGSIYYEAQADHVVFKVWLPVKPDVR